MRSYDNFAFYYDVLMKDANYSMRADYLLELLNRLKHSPGLTLDLACGTGNLLFELKKRGLDVYGVDISSEMLAQAKNKAYEMEIGDVLLLCQDMRKLDLYGTVDTVFCAMDSLNHLAGDADLQKTFNRVALFLNPQGYFVFDMNTIYKHREILSNNTFVFETLDVFCAWQNTYHKENHCVDIQLDFFERQGKSYMRSGEQFTECAYAQEVVTEMLYKAGFQTVTVYEDCSFSDPAAESQRVIYAAKKK